MGEIPDALVLAAGFSSRMGAFKPLLLYDDKTFIGQIIEKLQYTVRSITVVTGYNAAAVQSVVEDYATTSIIPLYTVYNENYREGMLHSLKTGIRHLKSDADWILYHFIDQPHLPDTFYGEFIAQIDNSFNWIQPSFNERGGHPLLLKNTLCDGILRLEEGQTLKNMSHATGTKKRYWECPYPEILNDFDRPEDMTMRDDH